VYSYLALEYIVRYSKGRPVRAAGGADGSAPSVATLPVRGEMTPNIKLMLYALVLNTTCLLIRAIYRTIELVDGWNGRIIGTEIYFNWLDGAMIVLALATFNAAHPGWLLAEAPIKSSSQTPTESYPV